MDQEKPAGIKSGIRKSNDERPPTKKSKLRKSISNRLSSGSSRDEDNSKPSHSFNAGILTHLHFKASDELEAKLGVETILFPIFESSKQIGCYPCEGHFPNFAITYLKKKVVGWQ